MAQTSQLEWSVFEHDKCDNLWTSAEPNQMPQNRRSPFALVDWLPKKGQCEQFSNRGGSLCPVQDDSLMAAMWRLHLPQVGSRSLARARVSFAGFANKLVT